MTQPMSIESMWNNIQSLLPSIDCKDQYSREFFAGGFPVNAEDSDAFAKLGPLFVNWPHNTNNYLKEQSVPSNLMSMPNREMCVDELIGSVKKVITDLYRCVKYTECFFENNSSLGGLGSGSAESATTISPIKWKNPKLYKTAMCDYWNSKKRCKYGNKCWFAHGLHELRFVSPQEFFNANNNSSNSSLADF